MNYYEFSHIFLPKIASEYIDGTLPFHALVDVDLWRQIFPDLDAAPGQVQWYNVKLNAFNLRNENNSLLITYSLPERRLPKECKFIGLRIDIKQNTLSYFMLKRPSVVDELWDLYQYNFTERREQLLWKIQTTDSLREFYALIERLPQHPVPHTEAQAAPQPVRPATAQPVAQPAQPVQEPVEVEKQPKKTSDSIFSLFKKKIEKSIDPRNIINNALS